MARQDTGVDFDEADDVTGGTEADTLSAWQRFWRESRQTASGGSE